MEVVKEAVKGVVRVPDDAHRVCIVTKEAPGNVL